MSCRLTVVGALLLLTAACSGGGSPMPTGPAPAATYTLSGTLTATNGGQPLGATLDFGVAASSSDASGRFSVTVPATAPTLTLAIAGPGVMTRRTYVTPGTRSVNLDAIAESGFDLGFYRELVRNGLENPALLPLRRWTRSPQVYLRTVDDDGAAIDARTLDSTEAAIRETVPTWTAGLFTAQVTRGADTRIGQAGWITVTWKPATGGTLCGQSNVAVEGGTIDLFYRAGCGARCATGVTIPPATVRHEVGHAMGFWHTSSPTDLMFALGRLCDLQPSARELAHAAIAYRRPVGNTDPDVDPVGAVNLAPLRVP